MSNLVLRVCIWILGFVALVGNTFVIIWRSIHSSGNKMHSFLIVNLGLGDLMMGVYLLIVAVVDLQYRGVYVAYEHSWRTSFLCQLAGFISTFSSELSVFTLTGEQGPHTYPGFGAEKPRTVSSTAPRMPGQWYTSHLAKIYGTISNRYRQIPSIDVESHVPELEDDALGNTERAEQRPIRNNMNK
ncbi:G-protein coupled receptor GRL101-like [Penaeus vannamei]|uniref:G-protein coupled receptor GRL101-like n=1 Tax=Penaeus vannamei TaxID=6689 RepID=UPI00387F620D